MKNFNSLVLFILVFGVSAMAQEVKKGDYSFLKGETSLKVTYDYSDMMVDKKEYDEAAFLEKQNSKNGDEWGEKWVESRTSSYQPLFEASINEELKKRDLLVSETAESNYTMVVKTTSTWPGLNSGTPTFIWLEIIYMDNATQTEVARYTLDKVNGQRTVGVGLSYTKRVGLAYEKAAGELGEAMAKSIK